MVAALPPHPLFLDGKIEGIIVARFDSLNLFPFSARSLFNLIRGGEISFFSRRALFISLFSFGKEGNIEGTTILCFVDPFALESFLFFTG